VTFHRRLKLFARHARSQIQIRLRGQSKGSVIDY
jgi:hypothetical protein